MCYNVIVKSYIKATAYCNTMGGNLLKGGKTPQSRSLLCGSKL